MTGDTKYFANKPKRKSFFVKCTYFYFISKITIHFYKKGLKYIDQKKFQCPHKLKEFIVSEIFKYSSPSFYCVCAKKTKKHCICKIGV